MDDAALWLRQAQSDLEAAEYNLRGRIYHVAAFLAQQAAEKSPKAVHIARLRSLWKIHNLVSLAQALKAPAEIVAHAKSLTPHYVATRYPTGGDGDYTEPDAADAVRRAREVVEWARGML